MPHERKPIRANDYDPKQSALVRSACLEVATRLQDFKEEVCIVGGLVPGLLVDHKNLEANVDVHVGTLDIDLGFSLAILNEQRYEEISKRFRAAGFERDKNDAGNPTSQRWRSKEGVLVDFLIPPSGAGDAGGSLRNLEPDFAAVITPGLHLAFQDREEVTLEGETLTGGTARREIFVCGPGAHVVLKSLAFLSRGENKDAYDLYYVVRGREDTTELLRSLLDDGNTVQAIEVIREDFTDPERIGPRRVAEFLTGGSDDDVQADVAGVMRALLTDLEGT